MPISRTLTQQPVWQILDIGSVSLKEFASALGSLVPVIAWSPVMSWTGLLQNTIAQESVEDPPLQVCHFPLQRGYHRFPVSALAQLGTRHTARMRARTCDPARTPLICTTPHYAPVAEAWEGPVVYYQTDLTFAYHGIDPAATRKLDIRMCRVATAVCPNSRRVGDYMVHEAGCDPAKIEVVPNATRAANITEDVLNAPGPLPADISDLPRPILGVIGNLAGNLNWALLHKALERTPEYSWAFVGPSTMEIEDPEERQLRASLLEYSRTPAGSRIRFVGAKPYQQLQAYARCFDVAILPYQLKEPTFSGSSTRFYEHLAACRPMLSTRGFEELLHLEPLVSLFDTPIQLTEKLKALEAQRFHDGFESKRWHASKAGTWQNRAATVIRALETRWAGEPVLTTPLAASPYLPVQRPFSEIMSSHFKLLSPEAG